MAAEKRVSVSVELLPKAGDFAPVQKDVKGLEDAIQKAGQAVQSKLIDPLRRADPLASMSSGAAALTNRINGATSAVNTLSQASVGNPFTHAISGAAGLRAATGAAAGGVSAVANQVVGNPFASAAGGVGALDQNLSSVQMTLGQVKSGVVDVARGFAILASSGQGMEVMFKTLMMIDAALSSARGLRTLGSGLVGAFTTSAAAAGAGAAASGVAGSVGAGAVSAAGAAGGLSIGTTALLAAAPILATVAATVLMSSSMQTAIAHSTSRIPILNSVLGTAGVAHSEDALAAVRARYDQNLALRRAGFRPFAEEEQAQQNNQIREPILAQQRGLRDQSVRLNATAQADIMHGAPLQIAQMRNARVGQDFTDQFSRAGVAGASQADRQASWSAEQRFLNLTRNPAPNASIVAQRVAAETQHGALATREAEQRAEVERLRTRTAVVPADVTRAQHSVTVYRRELEGVRQNEANTGWLNRDSTIVPRMEEELHRREQHLQSVSSGSLEGPNADLRAAEERLNATMQQRMQMLTQVNQLRGQERQSAIETLRTEQQQYENMTRIAQQRARDHRDETRTGARGIQMMDEEGQQRTLELSRRLAGGESLGNEDLTFLRGTGLANDQVNAQLDARNQNNPMMAEILANLGRPQEQARLDTDAARMDRINVNLTQQIETRIVDNSQQTATEITAQIQPTIDRFIQDLGNQMQTNLMQVTFQAIVRMFSQQQGAGQVNVTGGMPGG